MAPSPSFIKRLSHPKTHPSLFSFVKYRSWDSAKTELAIASLVSYLLDSGDCSAPEDYQAGGERELGTSFASRLYEHHPRNASLAQYIYSESTLHSFQYFTEMQNQLYHTLDPKHKQQAYSL